MNTRNPQVGPEPRAEAPPVAAGQQVLADALRVSFRMLRLTLLFLMVLYLLSGIFVVRQHQRAFVLLFGRVSGGPGERVREPGLHWTLPRPFAEVVRLSAARVHSLESTAFWYAIPAQEALMDLEGPVPPRLNPGRDGYTISGDANILHSRWVLRYTLDDPERFLFNFSNPEKTLAFLLEHAVVRQSAGMGIDRALRTEIEAFRSDVAEAVRQGARTMRLGVDIQRVDLATVAPPRQVAAAFDSVIEAEQERSRRISEASGYAARVLNEARGEGARRISAAEAYRSRLVGETAANADYFTRVAQTYRLAPEITAQTLRQDAVRRVLRAADERYILRRGEAGRQELRLLLSPPARRPGEPVQTP